MSIKSLIINPGSTSTKVGVFEDETLLFEETLRHPTEEIAKYASIIDQKDFRKDIILNFLKEKDCDVKSFDVIVGRGGLLKPIPGGTYEGIDLVNTDGTGFFLYGPGGDHGGRLIVLHEDDPSHYETNMLYWKDVVKAPLPTDGSATNGAVYMFYTRRYLPLLLLAGAGVTAGTLTMRRRSQRKQENTL